MLRRSIDVALSCAAACILSLVCLAAFADEPASAGKFELKTPLGLPLMKVPADNPLTAEKIELGKQLYFDPRLSADNSVSCATCHDPQKGWSNGAAVATGIGGQKGGRSAPTIINSGYSSFQFWDGRAMHVEGQALGPIQNPIEMNLTLEELVKKLSGIEGYRQQFQAVFGGETPEESITKANIAKAIGAFERTIVSGDAPYDRFKAGDTKALSDAAQRGMKLFFGKANCSACHSGPHLQDGGFHNIGHGLDKPEPDLGRHVHSKIEGDRGAFKTPTLREIARTAPYMHDGAFATLEEVVDYYNKGGFANPQLDEEIFALKLTDQDRADLVTFLREGFSSETYPVVEPPELPK